MGTKEDYFVEELTFDEMEIGMEFPDTTYALGEETVSKYIDVVDDRNPLYTDEAEAKKLGFGGVIAPATSVCLFTKPSNLLSGLKPKRRPPSGSIHVSQKYEFINVIRPGDVITSKSKVLDKYLKKGSKYVHIGTDCFNANGANVAVGESIGIWAK